MGCCNERYSPFRLSSEQVAIAESLLALNLQYLRCVDIHAALKRQASSSYMNEEEFKKALIALHLIENTTKDFARCKEWKSFYSNFCMQATAFEPPKYVVD